MQNYEQGRARQNLDARTVHETDRKPKSQENPTGVHPLVASTSVKTYLASCRFSHLTSSAILQEMRTAMWKTT